MSIVSFAVNCSSSIYKRLDSLYNRIAVIEPQKRPRIGLSGLWDIRRVYFDGTLAAEVIASEIVTFDLDKLRELEATLKLLWSPAHQSYVPYWQLWLSGTVFAGLLALVLHALSSALGSLSVYL